MTAPTELSSGSAPEPVTPEAAAVESAEPGPELVAAGPPTGAGPDEHAAAQLEQDASAELEQDASAELGEDAAEAQLDEDAGVALDEDAWAEADGDAGRRRGVSWLVTAAVAVVVIGLAGAVGALAVTTHGFKSKTIVTYRPAAVFRLRAGDCINSSHNGLSPTILSCASPHDAEVFATFSLTGSSWPGSAAIGQQASSGCADRMASYVNPALADAGLTQEYVYPNQKAWQAGVRTVVCEVSATTGQLTGSVRQGG